MMEVRLAASGVYLLKGLLVATFDEMVREKINILIRFWHHAF